MNKKQASALTVFSIILTLAGCGGSSGGDSGGLGGGGTGGGGTGGGATSDVVMVSLGDSVKNVLVEPGVADNDEPGLFDPYQILQRLAKIDFFGAVLGIESAVAATGATVTVYVSYPGDPDACTNGSVLGSYNFDGDFDTQPTSNTAVATTDGMGPGRHVVAMGSFEICLDISPLAIPMPAYVTVDEIAIEAEFCDLDALPDADILGSWSGLYSCSNVGEPDEVDAPIQLTILKNNDGSYGYVDDGAVCPVAIQKAANSRFHRRASQPRNPSGIAFPRALAVAPALTTWQKNSAGQ